MREGQVFFNRNHSTEPIRLIELKENSYYMHSSPKLNPPKNLIIQTGTKNRRHEFDPTCDDAKGR